MRPRPPFDTINETPDERVSRLLRDMQNRLPVYGLLDEHYLNLSQERREFVRVALDYLLESAIKAECLEAFGDFLEQMITDLPFNRPNAADAVEIAFVMREAHLEKALKLLTRIYDHREFEVAEVPDDAFQQQELDFVQAFDTPGVDPWAVANEGRKFRVQAFENDLFMGRNLVLRRLAPVLVKLYYSKEAVLKEPEFIQWINTWLEEILLCENYDEAEALISRMNQEALEIGFLGFHNRANKDHPKDPTALAQYIERLGLVKVDRLSYAMLGIHAVTVRNMVKAGFTQTSYQNFLKEVHEDDVKEFCVLKVGQEVIAFWTMDWNDEGVYLDWFCSKADMVKNTAVSGLDCAAYGMSRLAEQTQVQVDVKPHVPSCDLTLNRLKGFVVTGLYEGGKPGGAPHDHLRCISTNETFFTQHLLPPEEAQLETKAQSLMEIGVHDFVFKNRPLKVVVLPKPSEMIDDWDSTDVRTLFAEGSWGITRKFEHGDRLTLVAEPYQAGLD